MSVPRIIRSLLALGALVLAGPPAVAAAQTERITDYFSHIEVAADGVLTVSEVITVRATGVQIKRGIYRDFPTTYRRPGGGAHRVGFEVLEVKRDGVPIAYFTEKRSNGVRVYMGTKNKYINPGTYTYTFTYKTDRQLGFFAEHDELYWNVTGNDWLFPIDVTSVFVQLPNGATILEQTGYTGRTGERGRDYVAGGDRDGRTTFQTTRTLAPGEGFTIVVTWPKGYVEEPDEMARLKWWVRDYLPFIAGFAAFVLVAAFYLVVWLVAGRDPAGGTIIPRWKPPAGVSPAAARYVTRMAFDDKAIGAAVVSMAVKGHLVIEDQGRKRYRLRRNRGVLRAPLSNGEKAMETILFRSGDTATIGPGNHTRLKPALKALKSALAADFDGAHFTRNIGIVIVGVVLSALAVIATGAATSGAAGGVEVFVPVAIAVSLLGAVFFRALRTASLIERFIAAAIAGIVLASATADMRIVFGTAVALVVLNMVFLYLMKAPTMRGRRLLDEIEGFRMYLSTAEQDRLNLLHPPERTPALFEKYLPYAMALDVETEWGDQFKDILAAAAKGGEGGYQPSWYRGRSRGWSSPGRMVGAIGGSLGGAIASAASPPGSSSGSGGGGSSGGGGGGGGGGGF